MIEVRWRSEDLDGSQATILSHVSSLSAAPTTSSGPSSGSHGKGKIVAIGVVIPVVCIALLIFAVLCLLRRKKLRSQPALVRDEGPSDLPEPVIQGEKLQDKGNIDYQERGPSHAALGLPTHPSAILVPDSRCRPEEGIEVVHELANSENPGKHLHSGLQTQDATHTPDVFLGGQHWQTIPSDQWKEVDREAEGLQLVDDLPLSVQTDSRRDALQRELVQVREERERLYIEQLSRRERELELQLQNLDNR